jgi:hypothetical protein
MEPQIQLGAAGGFLIACYGAAVILGLVALVCNILVIVKMFQKGQTGLGIATAVLSFCGIGYLISLIYGWMNASAWDIKKTMLVYTLAFVLQALAAAGIFVSAIAMAANNPELLKQMQDQQKQLNQP